MFINFQQNGVSRSVNTVHIKLIAKNSKLHKFATCNLNFETKLTYHVVISTDDGRTDGQTDRQIYIARDDIRYFSVTKKNTKNDKNKMHRALVDE